MLGTERLNNFHPMMMTMMMMTMTMMMMMETVLENNRECAKEPLHLILHRTIGLMNYYRTISGGLTD